MNNNKLDSNKLDLQSWPAGIKRTKQRECILAVLAHADKPLTAFEIAERINKEEQNVWMSTIYRTLDFFVEKELITKTSLATSDMSLYSLTPHNHRHFAICTSCHKIIPLDDCPLHNIEAELPDSGFQVTGHNIEIYGLCSDCNKHKSDKRS